MQENENISTYPEEPTNPNDYEGFEKSVYYIFNLLRLMYYSKVESENKFYSKLGGVIGGNVTIQGNLVVNGVNYAIDTTHLNVGDYTITLAKDNEQTLTSMVGMVVPKYDGTNYGFFGWDADGYAYVGDLTNYDGTSDITLANNSSLQKIATIDTTNTVVASNGVIYVYDATSHCFKKPTNDNKYYVIRNGAFVETELFTEQKSKNIDNALYNIGAFDSEPTVSNGVVSVVRGTGYERADTLVNYSISFENYIASSYASNKFHITLPYSIDTNSSSIVNNLGWANNISTVTDTTIAIAISNSNEITIRCPQTSIDNFKAWLLGTGLQIQVKTTSTYTDKYIENTPNIALDQNGCNYLREEWEKGVQLFNPNAIVRENGFYNNSGVWNANTDYNVWCFYLKAGTYTINNGNDTNSQMYLGISILNNSYTWQSQLIGLRLTSSLTFTITSDSYVGISVQKAMVGVSVMLNTGTHAYPYQAYNGDIVHKVDIEPVLLWKNPNPNSAMTGVNKTIKDMSSFKYLIVEFSRSVGGTQGNEIQKFVIDQTYTKTGHCLSSGQYYREFAITTATNIYFAHDNLNSDNTNCVPIAIYGTNVL